MWKWVACTRLVSLSWLYVAQNRQSLECVFLTCEPLVPHSPAVMSMNSAGGLKNMFPYTHDLGALLMNRSMEDDCTAV